MVHSYRTTSVCAHLRAKTQKCLGLNEMVMLICSVAFPLKQHQFVCNKSSDIENAENVFNESMLKDVERQGRSLAQLGTITQR